MAIVKYDSDRKGFMVNKSTLPDDFDFCLGCGRKVTDFSDCFMCETTNKFFHRDCNWKWQFNICRGQGQIEHKHLHIVEVTDI